MGSSMMPQKKNPGPLELLRGRSGRIHGLHMAALTMMKGLPSGYNRDFHEDKEILVEIMALITGATDIVPPLIETTKLNLPRLAELPDFSFATATQLANFLVSEHQVAFRAAHHIVGSLVGELSRAGKDFRDRDYCMAHMKKNNIKCTMAELNAVLDPKMVMETYNSLGGTGPKAVAAMLEKFNAQLANHRSVLKADQARVKKAYDQSRAIAAEIGNVQSAEEIASLVKKHL
jgi:argininosuccinate lyase